MTKKLKGRLFGIFQHPFVEKYQKIEGGPSVKMFFFVEKKSHKAKNNLRKYPLAPLRFIDDVKILLRKLSKNCKKLRNCKIVRIVRKVDHSE